MDAIDDETKPKAKRRSRAKAEPKADAPPKALNEMQEKFAQALSVGMTVSEAAEAAGYSADSSRPAALAKDPRVVARVQELMLDEEWGGCGDLKPVINALRRLFDEAVTLTSAAALKERREILVQSARLKALLPVRQPVYVLPPPLTDEQWLEKHAPKNLAG